MILLSPLKKLTGIQHVDVRQKQLDCISQVRREGNNEGRRGREGRGTMRGGGEGREGNNEGKRGGGT